MSGGSRLKGKRAASAKLTKEKNKIETIQVKAEITEFVDQVPKVKGNDPQDYETLKRELVGILLS